MVIPAHNEALQLSRVFETMPDFVDKIVVVDDCSNDDTAATVRRYQTANDRIILLQHSTNQGCGGALATGYKWARDNAIDVAVRMDGDGQMNPNDLPAILDPVVEERADYCKGS